MTIKQRLLLGSVFLMGLISSVSAADTVIEVAGSVTTKGLLGILVSLGIENWVTSVQAMYLYNLISVCFILVIAAMAGPRSEAAFCVLVPIITGMFLWFGWIQLATKFQTTGFYYLLIVVALLGIMIYMNEQNRTNYGVGGPGAKVFNIALYLAFFGAALTLVSGFSIVPLGATQPISGACSVGYPCDTFNNIDMNSAQSALTSANALDVGGMLTWMVESGTKMGLVIINMLIGIFFFPLILSQTLNGLFPGVSTNATFMAFMVVMNIVIISIYTFGTYEWFMNRQGSTL